MATKHQETGSISCSLRKNIPFLPAELVFKILCQLPAHVLSNLRGRICRSWDKILHDPTFVKTHLSLAKNHIALLIQYHHLPGFRNCYQSLESDNKFRGDFRSLSSRLPGRVISSSGGVVLCSSREIIRDYETHTKEEEDLYVVNPETQQVSKLPCFSSSSSFGGDTGFVISLIPNTSEVKVLRYDPEFKSSQWHVITVGNSMSWRTINAPTITPEQPFPIDRLAPFSAGGVVYWAPGCWTTDHPSIMATDLRGVTASVLVRVQDTLSHQEVYKVVPAEDFACVLEVDSSLRSGNIWVLKDLYRSEWEWFYKFDAKPEVHSRMCFNSTAWLELDDNFQVVLKERMRDSNGQLLLTGYNFKTGESKVIFCIPSTTGDFLPHVCTLVSW